MSSIDFSPTRMTAYLTGGAPNSSDYDRILGPLTRSSKFNRVYSVYEEETAPGFIPTYYTNPLMYAGEPYFCPVGWRRYALDVDLTREQFEERYKDWPVAYHGTSRTAATRIMLDGFLAQNNHACFINKDSKAVFVTPSIKYAGHPRYAKIERYQGLFIQLALQLRIRKSCIKRCPGTIEETFSGNEAVDKNYPDNDELEWVFEWNHNRKVLPDDGIIVYGIMARITDKDPRFLPENQWWEESRERLKWDKY